MKPFIICLMGSLLASFALVGCATTKQVDKVDKSGFLSDGDYALMKEGVKNRAVLSYWASGVNWSKYTKFYVEPIQLWKADDPNSPMSKLSPADQKMLVDFLQKCLVDDLETELTPVDKPGPDVYVLRGAITEAKASRPVSNIASSFIPIGLAISYGKQAFTGTGIGVGDIQIEGEIRDGQTNQLLACGVDRRAGTKAWRSKFGGSWGDMKLSFHYWSQHLAERFAEEKAGTAAAG